MSLEQRPMAPLDSKPAFLADIRERLKDASLEDLTAYSLLLAQYGDNSGLDLLLEKHAGAGRETELDAHRAGRDRTHARPQVPPLPFARCWPPPSRNGIIAASSRRLRGSTALKPGHCGWKSIAACAPESVEEER